MTRAGTIFAVFAILTVSAPPGHAGVPEAGPGRPAPPSDASNLTDRVNQSIAKAQANDEAGAAALLDSVITDPGFADLPEPVRHAAVLESGVIQLHNHDSRAAFSTLKRATEMASAGELDWHFYRWAAHDAHDFGQELAALTTINQRFPEQFNRYDRSYVHSVLNQAGLEIPRDEARFRLIQALHDMHWGDGYPFDDLDELWRALILHDLEHGQLAQAHALTAELRSDGVIAEMLTDKRFDVVTAGAQVDHDLVGLARRELARRQAESAAAPDKLEGVISTAEQMYSMGMKDDALKLIDEAISRVHTGASPAFSDAVARMNWAYDLRSRILFASGRSDEALGEMERGAVFSENGAANVSQQLNLGWTYVRLERPKEALEAVNKVTGNMSDYGQMVKDGVLACAYAELGDATAAAKAMDAVKANPSALPGTLIENALCTNNLDLAASQLIASLNNEDHRLDALSMVQTNHLYQTAPPFEAEMRHRTQLLRERPDVKAAVDKVGRVIEMPYWGS